MAHERIRPEFSFDEEKIKQLKQIAPECFEDGKINFETLRQNLGDWTQDEEDNELEHFGLFWPGKKDARRLASIPPEGTLEPVYGEGLKADGRPDEDGINDSKNIFIEGENLEVLKILQKSYANKIKMIYIDPPYNTGNDFVYDDDFTEPLQEYLRRTGQIDEEGKPMTTNKRSDGRFHSKWLSMIYPRLRLARNLLKDDGVIFVSIDDNEVHNLRALMNEVFGEENYISTISVINNFKGRSDDKYVATGHEYLLVYQKGEFETNGIPIPEEYIKDYKLEDQGRKYRHIGLRKRGSNSKREDRPKMFYPFYFNESSKELALIKTSDTDIEILPYLSDGTDGCWRWGKVTAQKKLDQLEVKLIKKRNEYDIFQKDYLVNENGETKSVKPKSFWIGPEFSTESGTLEYKKLFNSKAFENPKPIGLILNCLYQAIKSENEIVLDFFGGSATTGQSVFEYNNVKNKKTKFILVQLPFKIEATHTAFKNGYKTISSLSKERLRRSDSNYGFKVFNLIESNYKKWDDVQGEDISQLENSLDLFNSSPLRDDWNKNKLITELILLEGFPLDASQSKSRVGSNEIIRVKSEMVPNTLLICLDEKIEENLIEDLELDSSSIFICLDSAISNQDKLRLSDKGLIKTI